MSEETTRGLERLIPLTPLGLASARRDGRKKMTRILIDSAAQLPIDLLARLALAASFVADEYKRAAQSAKEGQGRELSAEHTKELKSLFERMTPAQKDAQIKALRAIVAVQNGTATPAQKSYVTRVRSRRAEAQKGA